jgi:DNA primase
MEYEKLSYPEAIEKLADTYNFTLHYDNNRSAKKEKSHLIEKLSQYYISLLNKTPQALSYLHERGVFESSIERFGIGYAPASALSIKFLKEQMFTMQEAIELGVIGEGENNIYARFIERITFPIHSANGTVVGFGGRTISGHQAKYVNSPQSRIFNKSRLLYAYHLAKETIYRKKEIIITEGYLDVVMLHQAGFTQAVATLGTALTPEHLPLLRKGEPKVIMAYDGDKAGRAAALKAAKLLSISNFKGGVILFEGGLDPADMVKSAQIEELNHLFLNPIAFVEFTLTQILDNYNISNPQERDRALNESIGFLKTLQPFIQEQYRAFLASKMGISPYLINLKNSNKQQPTTIQFAKYDIWELSLIKTVLEYPSFTDQILDFIKPSFLRYHKEEFELALGGSVDDPRIMAISVDPQIRAFESEESLRSELCTFLRKHYERELKKIQSDNKLEYIEKTFKIRLYNNKIVQLRQGKLVNFE